MTNEADSRIAPRETVYPFAEFDQFMDDLGERFLRPFDLPTFGRWTLSPLAWDAPGAVRPGLRVAPTDVTDTGTAFRVAIEVPGIPKEKIEVRVKGTRVEVQGETSESREAAKPGYLHRERSHVGFSRSFELPEPVKAADAKATVQDGVLVLELPKLTPTPTPDEVKVPVQ